ncbi:unnamed protein product, partial [marine sediment metagenome]
QLFISGSANASPGPAKVVGGIQLFPYEAEANVKCYNSDNAQLLSSIPGKSTRGVGRVRRSGAKQALDLQAQHVAPKVRRDILQCWVEVLQGRGEVQLHVEGVTYKQYTELKKLLLTIKEVTDVTAKYRNKNAECSLQSGVNAETLAEKLVKVMKNLEITDVSQNVIKAKFKK